MSGIGSLSLGYHRALEIYESVVMIRKELLLIKHNRRDDKYT